MKDLSLKAYIHVGHCKHNSCLLQINSMLIIDTFYALSVRAMHIKSGSITLCENRRCQIKKSLIHVPCHQSKLYMYS